jgi:anaerobic selenocysteine-containing dehydrogenase
VGDDAKIKPYSGPAGGWGSVKAVGAILTQEDVAVLGSEILLKQNKTDGFACVSCSWAKPASPHPFEFCENGAKATAWEITTKTTTPEFFSKHTLTELRTWSDMDLEDNGRLNTTIYTNDDRFRGVYGGRLVVLINPKDIDRLGIEGKKITLSTVADDVWSGPYRGCRSLPTTSR